MSGGITAAVVAGAATAYGAYSQNKAQRDAAKAAREAHGPTTSYTIPHGTTQEDINRIINDARRLYRQGLHQEAARALQQIPGASGAFSDLVGDVTDRARNPSPTLAAGQQFVQDLLGGGTGGFDESAWAQSYMPKWMRDQGMSEQQALEYARSHPETQFGQMFESAAGSAAARGPGGPFARNPIYNELYGATTGTNMDRSYDLLREFIGGGGGAGFSPSGGSLGGPPDGGEDPVLSAKNVTPRAAGQQPSQGGPAGGQAQPTNVTYREQTADDRRLMSSATPTERAMMASGVSAEEILGRRSGATVGSGPSPSRTMDPTGLGRNQGPSGGQPSLPRASAATEIPDSMAVDSFFSQHARDFFDPSRLDPTNDPTLQPYVDALRAQLQEQFQGRADEIGDRFSASNTFNSSGRALALGDASGEMDQALSAELARVYLGSRQDALDRQERMLGQISGRDLAAMGDRTSRYGIDQSAAASRAASASSAAASRYGIDQNLAYQREALAANTDLSTRAQNLQAILGIQAGDQYGMDLLSGLGGALDQEQFGALGAIPGLEGTEQDWYGLALGGQQSVSGQNAAAGRARSEAAANAALSPGRDLDDYMRRILPIAEGFGTRYGESPPPPRYAGPSSGEAIAGGLLAGAATGLGTYAQWGR